MCGIQVPLAQDGGASLFNQIGSQKMAAAARGRPTGSGDKIWRDAVRLAALRKTAGDVRALDRLADKLIDLALEGDVAALKEIGDRLDGKAAQQLVHSGDANDPVHVVTRIERAIIDTATRDDNSEPHS